MRFLKSSKTAWVLLSLSLLFNAVFVAGYINARLDGHLPPGQFGDGAHRGPPGGEKPGGERAGGKRLGAERLGERMERRMGRLASHLDLNEEQRQLLSVLTGSLRSAGRDMRARIGPYRSAMMAEILSDTPDSAAIDEHLSAILGARAVAARGILSEIMAFRDSLTPEQRQKLTALVERRRGRGAFPPF